MSGHLLRIIQRRVARVAMGATAARGQGTPGVVDCAREFAGSIRLDRLATRDAAQYHRRLDVLTTRLQHKLPKSAASWGLARKLLNIFIRDCVYVGYFRRAYGLHLIEAFCEVPLDSITAERIRKAKPGLPPWPGVKYLTPSVSSQYQLVANQLSKLKGIAALHLDAYWWGARK